MWKFRNHREPNGWIEAKKKKKKNALLSDFCTSHINWIQRQRGFIYIEEQFQRVMFQCTLCLILEIYQAWNKRKLALLIFFRCNDGITRVSTRLFQNSVCYMINYFPLQDFHSASTKEKESSLYSHETSHENWTHWLTSHHSITPKSKKFDIWVSKSLTSVSCIGLCLNPRCLNVEIRMNCRHFFESLNVVKNECLWHSLHKTFLPKMGNNKSILVKAFRPSIILFSVSLNWNSLLTKEENTSAHSRHTSS